MAEKNNTSNNNNITGRFIRIVDKRKTLVYNQNRRTSSNWTERTSSSTTKHNI